MTFYDTILTVGEHTGIATGIWELIDAQKIFQDFSDTLDHVPGCDECQLSGSESGTLYHEFWVGKPAYEALISSISFKWRRPEGIIDSAPEWETGARVFFSEI